MTNDLLRPDSNFIVSDNKIKPLIECTDKEFPDADYYLYAIPKKRMWRVIAHCFSAYGSLDFLTDTRERRIY